MILFLILGACLANEVDMKFVINRTQNLEYETIFKKSDKLFYSKRFVTEVLSEDKVQLDVYFLNKTNKIFTGNGTDIEKYFKIERHKPYIFVISTEVDQNVKIYAHTYLEDDPNVEWFIPVVLIGSICFTGCLFIFCVCLFICVLNLLSFINEKSKHKNYVKINDV